VSFKNTMVILTSNIGSRTIASSSTNGSRLGAFMGRGGAGNIDDFARDRLRRLVLDEVKEHFKPELLNRYGLVVCIRMAACMIL
jgi:ATP-dependent Clp protease ATP-binding subunit ClpC